MTIDIATEDYPAILPSKLLEQVDGANEDSDVSVNLFEAHVEELKHFVFIAIDLTDNLNLGLSAVKVNCPKINRLCSWGSYAYSSWDDRVVGAVNDYLAKILAERFTVSVKNVGCIGLYEYMSITFSRS